ncbi:MAG: dUTP diphosphatase [Ndongobacter sp.]|nr:dUTP diphosphatase [Ndongobacter sp.]
MENDVTMRLHCAGAQPSYANECAAGLDLRVRLGKTLKLFPGDRAVLETGVSVEIPCGYFGLVAVRSGLGFRGLVLANGVGVIDEDYRGEIKVAVHHHGEKPIVLEDGERVAQLILIPYVQAKLVFTEQLSETERGACGMGSSGRF